MSTKWIKILLLVMKTAVALLFILAGSGKFQTESIMSENFVNWGLGIPMMYVVGVGEILGSLLLFFRKTFLYGIIILIIIMLGAASIHILNFEQMGIPYLNIILLTVLAILLIHFKRSKEKKENYDRK